MSLCGLVLIVACLLAVDGFVYSTNECPIVYIDADDVVVRKRTLCCGSPTNLTDCRTAGHQLFWSESELNSTDLYVSPTQSIKPAPDTPNFVPKSTHRKFKKGKYADLYPILLWKQAGWYTEDYEELVNEYWMDFVPATTQAHYTFALIYLILTTISLAGNVLVFTMIIKFKSLQTPSNYLVANLAVADFFMMSRGPIFIYNCLYKGPVAGYVGCQIYGVIGGLTGVGAIMSLALIAKDRYSVIVHPFDQGYKMTKTKATLSITFIWAYAAVFATMPLTGASLGIKPYVPEGYLTSCSFDYVSTDSVNRIFILCFFLCAWFVPTIIITTSYFKILKHVLTASVTRMGQERQQRKGEVRLAAVVLLVIAVWFLSWTPYATVALIGISGNRHILTPLGTMVPAVFCKTAATIDPFIYALSHPRFRNILFKIWCPRKYGDRRADELFNNQIAIWKSDGSLRFVRKDSSGVAVA
uniref:Opsin, ultraviolet-sensitive n=1 Tax=Lygus hesperus TaxID=30085 RepID=A0A0A9W8I3_LYGHE